MQRPPHAFCDPASQTCQKISLRWSLEVVCATLPHLSHLLPPPYSRPLDCKKLSLTSVCSRSSPCSQPCCQGGVALAAVGSAPAQCGDYGGTGVRWAFFWARFPPTTCSPHTRPLRWRGLCSHFWFCLLNLPVLLIQRAHLLHLHVGDPLAWGDGATSLFPDVAGFV